MYPKSCFNHLKGYVTHTHDSQGLVFFNPGNSPKNHHTLAMGLIPTNKMRGG